MLTCEAFKPNTLDNMTNVGYDCIKKGQFDFENLQNKRTDNIFGMLDHPVKPYKNERKSKVPCDARPELWFRNNAHVYEATYDPGPSKYDANHDIKYNKIDMN